MTAQTLTHANLQDLMSARANARRWSSAATVAALEAEINRRLGN